MKGKATQQLVLMALCKYNTGSYTFVKQWDTASSPLPQVHSCVTKPQQPKLPRATSKPCDLLPPPLTDVCYTQASKFQLSLKPAIYKLLLYTPLLEYVTHTYDFLQWRGDGRQQTVLIPLIRRAYTLPVHLSSILMYCSFTSCHCNFFLLINSLQKRLKNQQKAITLTSSNHSPVTSE